MPQTLLAFLAMMIATMAAFNQHAATIRVQEEMVKSELEIMANAVALEAVELQAVPAGFAGVQAFNSQKGATRFSVDERQVDFTLQWSVRFVDGDGVASEVETDIREVTVAVFHPRYDRPLVTHTRLIGK